MTHQEHPPIKRIEVEGQQEGSVSDQAEREPSHQRALDQIDTALDHIQTKLDRAKIERGALGKALNFIKEKLLRRETADQTLEKQLTELTALRTKVEADPAQAQAALDYVSAKHGMDLLVENPDPTNVITERAQLVYDQALDAGKPLEMEAATRIAKQGLDTEEELMRDWFAAGDVMNAHGEAETAAQEGQAASYKEKYDRARADDEVENYLKAPAWEERLQSELDLNDEFVRDTITKSKDNKIVTRPIELSTEARMIRDWFDEGTHRDIAMQRAAETANTAGEVYQKEIARATKSTKAQTMAFDLFLSGRMALDTFAKKLAAIRKDLGPGLMIDHAARAGAEHELASKQVFWRLSQSMKELGKYNSGDVELYRTTNGDRHELAVVIPKEKRVINITGNDLDRMGIFSDEVEKIAYIEIEELASYALGTGDSTERAVA